MANSIPTNDQLLDALKAAVYAAVNVTGPAVQEYSLGAETTVKNVPLPELLAWYDRIQAEVQAGNGLAVAYATWTEIQRYS